jgi:hypothetical protein
VRDHIDNRGFAVASQARTRRRQHDAG